MLKASLKVVGGNHDEEIIPLHAHIFLIGREQDCHLRPNSDLVSRHHCAFTLDDYSVRLRDLGSTNGTFVNEERLHGEIQLKAGDRVLIGKLTVELQIADPASPQATPSDSSIPLLQGETAVIASEETAYDLPAIPSVAEPAVAEGETTVFVVPEQPEQSQTAETPTEPEVVGVPPATAPGQQPAAYPVGQYPPQPMPYPTQPAPYPQPGYYPQYYPQQMAYPPQMMPQMMPGQPIPVQFQPPAAQPEANPAVPTEQDLSQVSLPDPATTGATEAPPPVATSTTT